MDGTFDWTYAVQVRAQVSSVWSDPSVSATDVCERPAGPSGLSVSCSSRLVVAASWDADSDASSYSAASTGGLAAYGDSDNGFTRRGQPGVQYTVTVKSLINGVWSAASEATATCPDAADVSRAVLADIAGLTLSCGTDGWVRANWNPVTGADEYEASGSFTTTEIEATQMRWKGTSGADHTVRVKAWDQGLHPSRLHLVGLRQNHLPPVHPPGCIG